MRAIALTRVLIVSAMPAMALALPPGSVSSDALVGTWHSRTTSSEGTVTLRGDGTFDYRPSSEPRTITGEWRLRDGAIVWSYAPRPDVQLDPRLQPDVNPIVERSPSRLVLREADGTVSVFTREPAAATTPQPAPPESRIPEVVEQLGAAAVVLTLIGVAVLAWRALRSRPAVATTGTPIFPCLKDRNWAQLGPTLRRPLADVEGTDWIPWVGFGYDRPDEFEFLQERDLQETGRSLAAIEAEALANLADREASWQMVEMGGKDTGPMRMVMCTDDFFAAERILEPESVLEAQRRLGGSALLAGVPRRGVLLLMDADAGPAAMAWLVMRVAEEYFEGQSAPISPLVFRMSGGKIVGALPSASRSE